MVTIKEVAGKSGVSITTVSMVLNDGPSARRISEPTRRRIWKVANRLGYRPNIFARSLRSNRSRSIGIVTFDITDPYCAQILRAIETQLQSSGYFPALADLQNDRTQFQRCLDRVLERRVEGVIVIAGWAHLEIDLRGGISGKNLPAVMVGKELKGQTIGSVVTDNEAGARLALQHLDKLGHRKIAVIKGPKTLTDSALRWNGLESYAREAGLWLDPALVVELKGRNSTYTEGCELTEELLQRDHEFTGLIAFDDLTACAAIRALTKSGRQVPTDCSVVGFDDIPNAAFYNPPLTTIHQQLEVQGTLAAEMVEESIRGALEKRSPTTRHRKVAPQLVIRESTCAAPLA
jgi:LacI family transcriptional regulator